MGETIEDRDGFVPKTMLSLPIFNGQRDVIGVAQLINKVRQKNELNALLLVYTNLIYIYNPSCFIIMQ